MYINTVDVYLHACILEQGDDKILPSRQTASAEIVLVLFFRCDQQTDESVDEGRLTCDMSCHCPCSHMPMMGCPVLELAGGKSFVDAG